MKACDGEASHMEVKTVRSHFIIVECDSAAHLSYFLLCSSFHLTYTDLLLMMQGAPQKDTKLAAGIFNMFQDGCLHQFLGIQNNNGLLQKLVVDVHIPAKMNRMLSLVS
jgi:hypothetical protein